MSKVVEALGLSYRTADELNTIIDKKLPGYPPFKSLAIKIGGEEVKFHYWDILLSIQALYGNPEFARDLIFAPERHYLNSEKACRVYSEMHTGDWWWSVQVHNVYFGFSSTLRRCSRRRLNHSSLARQLYHLLSPQTKHS